MTFPNFDSNLVIRYLVSYLSCETCGNSYRLEDIHIIDEEDDAWALVVQCAHCGTEGLVLAVANPLDEEDIAIEDAPVLTSQWTPGLAPLTAQDVAEWRAFLANFTGDLQDLLQVDG